MQKLKQAGWWVVDLLGRNGNGDFAVAILFLACGWMFDNSMFFVGALIFMFFSSLHRVIKSAIEEARVNTSVTIENVHVSSELHDKIKQD